MSSVLLVLKPLELNPLVALDAVSPLPLVKVEKLTLATVPVDDTETGVPESPHVSHLPMVPCPVLSRLKNKFAVSNMTATRLCLNKVFMRRPADFLSFAGKIICITQVLINNKSILFTTKSGKYFYFEYISTLVKKD